MGRENPLGYKTITFRQLCHAVQTSGRTRLLQPRVYEDYRKKKEDWCGIERDLSTP